MYMKRLHRTLPVVVAFVAFVAASAGAQQSATSSKFTARDVFDLEWVWDPQISPDGRRVVFGRTGYDIMTDARRSALWIANSDGSNARPLLSPQREAGSPRWSPDGSRILFVATVGGKSELVVRWMTSGRETLASRSSPTLRARPAGRRTGT
jgi:dipeptidyl aminopeptidase/acylaminoacyl peptidase